MSGSALLSAGAAGGVLSAIAAAAMYLRPGTAAGIAMTTADLLVLFGLVGLDQSSGGAVRRRAIAFMGANVIAAVASLVLPRIGIGPIFDLFGALSWLADAAAYGVLGGVLLRHRTDVHPGLGVAAGIASVLLLAFRILFCFVCGKPFRWWPELRRARSSSPREQDVPPCLLKSDGVMARALERLEPASSCHC
jgi:hypothetical protein